MSRSCRLVVNGQTIDARVGETLVDAGLGGWVVIPHDCCSGQCETCRVTVVGGAVDDRGTRDGHSVLACQATLAGDAEIHFDEMPAASSFSGVISSISPLARDVVEVIVKFNDKLAHRPGHYFNVKFSGFPARDFSPTLRLDGTCGEDELVFQISRFPGGLVSTQIGATIRAGHRVRARGPFGSAFLREGQGPLVLVSGGTGFAPIWSIAHAARQSQSHRDLVVIAGARDLDGLYMRPALEWLSESGVRDVIATIEQDARWPVLRGRPSHYLPSLGPEDTVYVAGPQGLVDVVKAKSRRAAARCYADPFLPSVQRISVFDRIVRLISMPKRATRNAEAAAVVPAGRSREVQGDAVVIPSPPADALGKKRTA